MERGGDLLSYLVTGTEPAPHANICVRKAPLIMEYYNRAQSTKILRLFLDPVIYNPWICYLLTSREGSRATWFIAVIKISKILFAFSSVTERTEQSHSCAAKWFLPWYPWSFRMSSAYRWNIYPLNVPGTANFSTPQCLIFAPSRCHYPHYWSFQVEKSENSVNLLLLSGKNLQTSTF